MAQLQYIDGMWVDPIKRKEQEDGTITFESVIKEFDDNTNKLQAEYKDFKENLEQENRLNLIESKTKKSIVQKIVDFRNGLFNK